MFAHKFYKLETFPFYTTIQEWGRRKYAMETNSSRLINI